MGLIAVVKSFTRLVVDGVRLSDVKVDPGGGANITGNHFADAGDDSHPLPTDYAFLAKNKQSGGHSPVGYADPINDPKAGAGEKRIYGRDSSGAVVNEVWLKADGSVIVSNTLGSTELKADGEVSASNDGGDITLKPAGTLEANATTSITATAPAINLTGNVIISGSLTLGGGLSAISGSVVATGGLTMTGGDITADGISVKTHPHPQGNDSDGDTQVNTGAPL